MKKWILSLLVVVCVACGALGLAACVPAQYQGGGHNYSEEWNHNIDEHWHACQDRGCSSKSDKDAHKLALIKDEKYYRAPTCETLGRGLHQCVDCGAYVVDSIPVTEHNYVFSFYVTEPSCNEEGRGMYVCTECSDVESRVEPALGNHEFGTKWESNKEGHFKVCINCNTKSEVIPHKSVKSAQMSTPVSGMDDGEDVFVCEECGNETDRVPVVNTDAPNNLEITFVNVSSTEENGIHIVYLNLNTQYNIRYSATRAKDGKNVPVQPIYMVGQYGVRAYLLNVDTMKENVLDYQNMYPVNFGFESSTNSRIKVEEAGEHVVVFKYETGWGTAKHQVRAKYTVRIICGTKAANINELGVQFGAIDDGVVCLATGAYDSKAY